MQKISSDMYGCCGGQPTHIFIYENGQVLLICKSHFASEAHRFHVKNILDYKTGQKLEANKNFDIKEGGQK